MRSSWHTQRLLVLGLVSASLVACGDPVSSTVNSTSHISPDFDYSRIEVVLDHDFGITRPGRKHSHRFEVFNSSNEDWTIKSLRTTCSCTVASVSSDVISAGASGFVTVNYVAGGKTNDDRRKVSIEFREPNTPIMHLSVNAMIREDLAIKPEEVAVDLQLEGAVSTVYAYAHNFTDSRWDGLEVKSSLDAISVAIDEVPRSNAPVVPGESRQEWRLSISVNPTGLESGQHIAELSVTPSCSAVNAQIKQNFLVHLRVAPPVTVIPSKLFFGKVGVNCVSTRQIKLIFSLESKPEHPDMISFSNDLVSDQLSVACVDQSNRILSFNATLQTVVTSNAEDIVNGSLYVESKDHRFAPLIIPIVFQKAVQQD